MDKRTRYSPEVRERTVRLVQEHLHELGSKWAAIRSIATKVGCTAETLCRWVRQDQRDVGRRPGLTTAEQQQIKVLGQENRELRRAHEILRKASVYLPRQGSSAAGRDGGSSTRTGSATESSRSVPMLPIARRPTMSRWPARPIRPGTLRGSLFWPPGGVGCSRGPPSGSTPYKKL